jgi:hypothetical protein
MEKKEIYFGIFVLWVMMFISCSNNSNTGVAKSESVPINEDSDTVKTVVEDSLNCDSVTKVTNSEKPEEKSTNNTVKRNVFEIYKNGVRQKIVIAWTPTPDNASEDYVWFVYEVGKYFNETNPSENLMFYSWPPEGISDKDMHNFAKEMGYEDAYAGYYLISADGEKGFIQHNVVPQVISGIYIFFNIEEPIAE